MAQYGNYVRTIAVILALALPALTIRAISNRNEQLHLLPLAPDNRSRAVKYEGREKRGFATIDVHVRWPQNWSGALTQIELQRQLADTLKHQTDFYSIEFVDQPGGQVEVLFDVGANHYGPFSPENMVDGIETALIALRMTNGPENR